jgi:hypothetical protein
MVNRKAFEHVMSNVRLRRQFRHYKRVIAVASMAALFSGCVMASPNGFRATASLGIEEVQEHEEKFTVRDKTSCGGLKAWVVGCGQPLK